MPSLQIIIASTRPGRVGLPVAQWFHARAVAHGGFDVELVDLAEVALPFLDEPTTRACAATSTSTRRTGARRSTPPTRSRSSCPSTTTASTRR
jgi:NAD(P)H-dependent FMN reductase